MHPHLFNIPHDEFRKGQLETIEWLRDPDRKGISFVEAPVGSGKSATGAALGLDDTDVRVLTATKSLQAQYSEYDFEVLYGLGNYDCALMPWFDASYCTHTDNMYKCHKAKECTYLNQRDITRNHYRQSLSYAYFLSSSWPRSNYTDYLYLDEGHKLPDIVMAQATLDFSLRDIANLDLDKWPIPIPVTSRRRKETRYWLNTVRLDLEDRTRELEKVKAYETDKGKGKVAKVIKGLELLISRVINVNETLDENPKALFLLIEEDRLAIYPLTAKFHFSKYFPYGNRMVITSATLGNPHEFAQTLGISKSNNSVKHRVFEAREVPSNFPPEDMPIYVPGDAPRMNVESGDNARQKQAEIIADILNDADPNWNGLIHTTSKYQAKDLANRLAELGFEDRVWVVPQKVGTEVKFQKWLKRLKKVPNTICISWCFHEGIDGQFLNMNILAKVPYANLDTIGMAKKDYDPRHYSWQAAITAMQAMGRNRRGEPEHYGPKADRLNYIVDANVWNLWKFYSNHFKKCLVRL